MMNLKEMFQLSDRGAKDLKKGIFAIGGCHNPDFSGSVKTADWQRSFLEQDVDSVRGWCLIGHHSFSLLQKRLSENVCVMLYRCGGFPYPYCGIGTQVPHERVQQQRLDRADHEYDGGLCQH